MRVARCEKNETAVVVCLMLVLLVSATSGCHLVVRTPEVRVVPGAQPHLKIVDGYLHVAHSPCPPSMVAPPAAITVTDLHTRSIIYLNGDGTVSPTQKPDYRTDEGRERLQTALADRSTLRLIIALPKCPE